MAFNDSEARDDHGRWTSGGGGSDTRVSDLKTKLNIGTQAHQYVGNKSMKIQVQQPRRFKSAEEKIKAYNQANAATGGDLMDPNKEFSGEVFIQAGKDSYYTTIDKKKGSVYTVSDMFPEVQHVQELKPQPNLAKIYRQAGIKGMSESSGSTPIKKKVEYKSQYNMNILRNPGESLQEWKQRIKK